MSEIHADIQRMAAFMVEVNQELAGAPLDYSPASLRAVDDMLARAAADAATMPAEFLPNLVQMVGCYLLEVASRQCGGEFFWHERLQVPVLVVGAPVMHIALIPWEKVRQRLSGGEGGAVDIAAFYADFANRVETARPGENTLYI